MVLPYIDMNPPWVYVCSPSRTPLPTPSPSHPSGSSQCTCPEHPVSCIETGLTHHFTYIIYMFQCHSPKSSHPRPLPQSPKDCYIHLCLFCCLIYKVTITIFLIPYICISILCWWFSFWFISFCIIGSSFIHLIRTDSNALFLITEWYSTVYMYHSFLSIHLLMDI